MVIQAWAHCSQAESITRGWKWWSRHGPTAVRQQAYSIGFTRVGVINHPDKSN